MTDSHGGTMKHGGGANIERGPLNGIQKLLTRVLATSLGLGYSPIAPGTAGTLLPMAVLILAQPTPQMRGWPLLVVTVAVFLVGVVVAFWGERLWTKEDPGFVTIDEVAGYLTGVLFVSCAPGNEIYLYIAAFFLFRLFDIIKPPPARASERLPGGWGIMTDDIFAGIYTNVVLQVVVALGWL